MRRAVQDVRRPHPKLLQYWFLTSLLLGPLFPVLLLPRWFKYRTLRYDFGDDGISMRWGVLFRREIHLTYPRIQDIHLRSNLVERWLGLGRLLIQTASGSAHAEMTIEGVLEFEELRDFIYDQMREAGGGGPGRSETSPQDTPELAAVLQQVAGELREIRALLERRAGS